MKQNGVQVAIDFLGTLPLRPAGSGLVLVSCDDPEGRNSGSGEMDTRPVAKWLDIPLLEPGDMQEAKDMTKWLFDVSEELDIVCMLRCVSKISLAEDPDIDTDQVTAVEDSIVSGYPVYYLLVYRGAKGVREPSVTLESSPAIRIGADQLVCRLIEFES